MIYLTKGQILFENPGMVVYDPTGYYEDGAPVICAPLFSPEEPVCRFEAKFIAYGSQVYSIADADKLMEEVVKIDPDSLLGKSTGEIAVEKMVENIQTADSIEPTLPLTPPPPLVESPTEDPVVIPETPVIENATPAAVLEAIPETIVDTPPDLSTTTPTTIDITPIINEVTSSVLNGATTTEIIADKVVSFAKRKIIKKLTS